MGRKRKPIEEQKDTLFVSLPNKVIWELEKVGNKNQVARDIVLKYFEEFCEKSLKNNGK